MKIFENIKYIIGEPDTGIHEIKFLNTAIIDYFLTIMLAVFTSYISNIPLVLTTIFWFIFGIIMHIIFEIDTHTMRYIKNILRPFN